LVWAWIGAVAGLVAFVGIGLVAPGFGFTSEGYGMWTGGYTAVALCFACILLIATTSSMPAPSVLRAFGVAAYPLYLLHLMVWLDVGPGLLAALITLSLAAGAHIVVERPLLAWGRARWRYGASPPLPRRHTKPAGADLHGDNLLRHAQSAEPLARRREAQPALGGTAHPHVPPLPSERH
jgi:peptidoglycan/LPS O-acetylase OafA/YrhL